MQQGAAAPFGPAPRNMCTAVETDTIHIVTFACVIFIPRILLYNKCFATNLPDIAHIFEPYLRQYREPDDSRNPVSSSHVDGMKRHDEQWETGHRAARMHKPSGIRLPSGKSHV